MEGWTTRWVDGIMAGWHYCHLAMMPSNHLVISRHPSKMPKFAIPPRAKLCGPIELKLYMNTWRRVLFEISSRGVSRISTPGARYWVKHGHVTTPGKGPKMTTVYSISRTWGEISRIASTISIKPAYGCPCQN
jgi:hypothetical protein